MVPGDGVDGVGPALAPLGGGRGGLAAAAAAGALQLQLAQLVPQEDDLLLVQLVGAVQLVAVAPQLGVLRLGLGEEGQGGGGGGRGEGTAGPHRVRVISTGAGLRRSVTATTHAWAKA